MQFDGGKFFHQAFKKLTAEQEELEWLVCECDLSLASIAGKKAAECWAQLLYSVDRGYALLKENSTEYFQIAVQLRKK